MQVPEPWYLRTSTWFSFNALPGSLKTKSKPSINAVFGKCQTKAMDLRIKEREAWKFPEPAAPSLLHDSGTPASAEPQPTSLNWLDTKLTY